MQKHRMKRDGPYLRRNHLPELWSSPLPLLLLLRRMEMVLVLLMHRRAVA